MSLSRRATVFPIINLYTYLQCALRGRMRAESSVHLQTDHLVTSQEPHLGSTAWSLPLAKCEPCTPNFLSLVTEGSSFEIPVAVLSSPVSRTLQSFCTKSGQELAWAHQTCLLRFSAEPKRFQTRRPLKLLMRMTRAPDSPSGVQSRSGARVWK